MVKYGKMQWLSLACLFLFLSPLFAQQTITLNDAIRLLEENNIEIRQMQYKTSLSHQDVKDAKNALLPIISLGANHNYIYGLTFDQISGQLITGNRWTNSANANLGTQVVLFQGFALRDQIRTTVLTLQENHAQTRVLNRALKLQMLQFFFNATINQALHSSSLSQLRFSQEQLVTQKEQLALGSKTLVDVSLAESQVAIDEYNVLTSKNNKQEALVNLKQLINMPYTDSIQLIIPQEFVSQDDMLSTETTLFLSIAQTPEIAQANAQLKKAILEKAMAKNRYLPSLSFSGGYGTNYSSERRDFTTGRYMSLLDQIGQNESLNLGVSLSAPIFDGFRVKSAKKRAHLQFLIQTEELQKVEVEQEKIYRLALQEMQRSHQEHLVSQKRFESLETALNAMAARYELGVASAIDYNKALLDRNLAEFNVITSKYSKIYAQYLLAILCDYY